jgi:hypothetical protein
MTQDIKPKKKWGVLIWCTLAIGIGIILFLILSAFGALRFWQAEKTPQGKTDLASSRWPWPLWHG